MLKDLCVNKNGRLRFQLNKMYETKIYKRNNVESILPISDLPPQSVESVQNFIKNLFIKERTGVQKSKNSRHDLQWKFHILASCVDLLVWSAKDDSGL
jgi:hypothetical protein